MESEERVTRVEIVAHPLDLARSIVEIAAFVVAAVWGLYVFAYQEIIKPASEPPRLELGVVLSHAAVDAKNIFVTVRVNYQNVGKSEIDVAADRLTVWGRRIEERDERNSTDGAFWLVDRSRATSKRELVFDVGVFRDAVVSGTRGRRFLIAAGASASQQFTFIVPARRFHIIEIGYDSWFLRSTYGSDRVALTRRRNPDGSSIIMPAPGLRGAEVYSSNGVVQFPI